MMCSLAHSPQFMAFLQHSLQLSEAELHLILQHQEAQSAPLPMLLWQYGLISIQQLDQIFDWLEHGSDCS